MSSPRVPLRQSMLSRTNLICLWIHVQFGMSTPPVNIPNLARFFLGAFFNMPVTQRVPWSSRTSKMVKNYIEKNQNVQIAEASTTEKAGKNLQNSCCMCVVLVIYSFISRMALHNMESGFS